MKRQNRNDSYVGKRESPTVLTKEGKKHKARHFGLLLIWQSMIVSGSSWRPHHQCCDQWSRRGFCNPYLTVQIQSPNTWIVTLHIESSIWVGTNLPNQNNRHFLWIAPLQEIFQRNSLPNDHTPWTAMAVSGSPECDDLVVSSILVSTLWVGWLIGWWKSNRPWWSVASSESCAS